MTPKRVATPAALPLIRIHIVTWAVVVACGLLAVFSISAWPLIIFCVVGVAAIIRQRSTTTFGIAASILLHLAAVAVLIQLAPLTRLPLALTVSVCLVLEGLVVGFVISRFARWPGRQSLLALARYSLFFVTPIIASVVMTFSLLIGRSGVAWAMGNDSPANVSSARILFADGGVNSRLHFNGSPEPHSLLTVVAGPGRWTVSSWDLLAYDISAYAQLWFLLIVATAALSALVAKQAMPQRSPLWFGIVSANAIALVPLTWFVAGYSILFGFFNATLSVVILLCSWLVARGQSVSPGIRLSALGMASLALLATWGPLAIIPVALGIHALWQFICSARSAQTHARRRFWIPGAVFAVSATYIALVTVPDLLSSASALGNDGGIKTLSPRIVGLSAAVLIVTAAIYSMVERSPRLFIDSFLVTLLGAGALAFLVFQRRAQPDLWGYYPVKFAWIMMTIFGIVSLSIILALVARVRYRGLIFGGIASVMALGIGVAIASIPDIRARVFDALPLLAVAGIPSPHPADPAARFMMRNKEDGVNTIAVNALTPTEDGFINLWLFQMEPLKNNLDVRIFAYGLDANNTSQVCTAISKLTPPVRILTSEAGLRERLVAQCPSEIVDIVAPSR